MGGFERNDVERGRARSVQRGATAFIIANRPFCSAACARNIPPSGGGEHMNCELKTRTSCMKSACTPPLPGPPHGGRTGPRPLHPRRIPSNVSGQIGTAISPPGSGLVAIAAMQGVRRPQSPGHELIPFCAAAGSAQCRISTMFAVETTRPQTAESARWATGTVRPGAANVFYTTAALADGLLPWFAATGSPRHPHPGGRSGPRVPAEIGDGKRLATYEVPQAPAPLEDFRDQEDLCLRMLDGPRGKGIECQRNLEGHEMKFCRRGAYLSIIGGRDCIIRLGRRLGTWGCRAMAGSARSLRSCSVRLRRYRYIITSFTSSWLGHGRHHPISPQASGRHRHRLQAVGIGLHCHDAAANHRYRENFAGTSP